ncbi:hypothetical protein HRbin10_00626 [bacterium HR10]|nr:hypothetical protein HRbin10_00626 [bacterium HR10]
MKYNRGILASSLTLALLAFGALSPMKHSAEGFSAFQSETIVEEEEPNDTPRTAQVVPFPRPGEKVIFRGRIARGDKGSRSEELESFFNQFDLEVGEIQDWIVADPDALGEASPGDGPIPLRITADWGPVTSPQQAQQEADLDFWVGTFVDDQTFFIDGFKVLSDIQMATDQRPESWPRPDQPHHAVVLYLQPKGVRTGDGEPLPNDGFARKLVIGIQHFGGPAAEYTVTLENLGGSGTEQQAATGPESHQVDDGVISARFFRGPSGGILLNRFRPSRYPARLVAVSHPFLHFRDLPDPTGKSIRVLVLAGESDRPDAAPPPLDQARVLFDKALPIPRTIEIIGEVIDLPIDPPVTIESGVVYVGFQFPADPIEQTGIALALDPSPAQFLRTYLSTDNGQTWGRPRRDEPFTGLPVFLNADIRATFTFGKAVSSQIVRESSVRRQVLRRTRLQPLRIERPGEVKAGEIVGW